jgi:hypothetical protein
MKKLNIEQMEKIEGGIDCSTSGKLALIAGATVGGAIFFGWGAIVAGYGAAVYTVMRCDGKR